MKKNQNADKILKYARKHGIIRVRDALREGIHPEYLRRLCKKGTLTRVGRGMYIPADEEISPHIGLVQIAKRIPHGVICLLSALQFHDIGTQSPFEVWIAIEGKAAQPRIE